jgi:L-asparaginase II
MSTHPDMVAGPNRFDTRLMQVAGGKVVTKGGAEGYQSVAVAPGVIAPGSPGLGICVKIADGDREDRARPVVVLAILRQLGVLTPAELEALKSYDARPIYNWRKLEVGEIRPAFTFEPLLTP